MRQLITYIKQSVYSPDYYRELLLRPFSYSWKYYSGLAMLIAVFLTIVSSIPLVPKINQATKELPSKFFAYYPDELELKAQQGVLVSNVEEPYILPLPEMFKKDIAPESGIEHLAVIDTATPISLQAFRSYKVFAWVGKDAIAFYDNQQGIRIEPFGKDTNFVVNESVLRAAESRLSPYYVFIAPTMVLIIFLGLMLALGVNFAYLVFGSLLIWLFAHVVLKQKWGYGTSYRVGLHAITLSLLLDTLFSVVGINLVNLPFLQTALMLAVVYVNFKDMRSVEADPAPTPTVTV